MLIRRPLISSACRSNTLRRQQFLHGGAAATMSLALQRRWIAAGGERNIGSGGPPLDSSARLTNDFYCQQNNSNSVASSSSSAGTKRDNGCSEENWADDDLDGMDLSGITFIKTDPATLERKKKTRLFVQRLFTVPTEQEAIDMIYAAVAVHRTLRAHHLAAICNEARRQKFAWIALREAGAAVSEGGADTSASVSAGNSYGGDDGSDAGDDELAAMRKRRAERRAYHKQQQSSRSGNDNASSSSSPGIPDESDVVPLAYPLARAVVLFTAAMDAGFLALARDIEFAELTERAEQQKRDGCFVDGEEYSASAIADPNARFVVGRELEGLVKLLLDDVLRSAAFKQWDDEDVRRAEGQEAEAAAAADKMNKRRRSGRGGGEYDIDEAASEVGTAATNNVTRSRDDAAAAWSVVALMARFGLALSSPKVVDALETVVAAGVADRFSSTFGLDGGTGSSASSSSSHSQCPELERHARQSYKLSIANRSEFLHEQRERLAREHTAFAGKARRAGGRSAEREPSSHRL